MYSGSGVSEPIAIAVNDEDRHEPAVERALRVLIHDLRTPVGVAQGYLRLLQQNRLGGGEARDQAFSHALRALDTIARLAHDADRLMEGPPAERVAVPARQLIERVTAKLPPATVDLSRVTIPAAVVTLPPDVDALADALVDVLRGNAAKRPTAAPGSVEIGSTAVELWFASGGAGGGVATRAPLDVWSGPGLAWPVACITVGRCGGQLWAGPAVTGGVGVAFPLQEVP